MNATVTFVSISSVHSIFNVLHSMNIAEMTLEMAFRLERFVALLAVEWFLP